MFKNKKAIAIYVFINLIVLSVLTVSFSVFFSSKVYMVKKNYDKNAIRYVYTTEKKDNTYLSISTSMDPIAFVDFEKEKFKLIEGKLPLGEREVIISDIYAKYHHLKVGDNVDNVVFNLNSEYLVEIVGIYETGIFSKQKKVKVESLNELHTYFTTRFTSIDNYPAFEEQIVYANFSYEFKSRNRKESYTNYISKVDKEDLKNDNLLIGNEIVNKNDLIISVNALALLSGVSVDKLQSDYNKFYMAINKNIMVKNEEFTIVGVHKSADFQFATYNNIAHLSNNASYIINIDNLSKSTKLRSRFLAHDPLESTLENLNVLRVTFGIITPVVLLFYALYNNFIFKKVKKIDTNITKFKFYKSMLKHFGMGILAFMLIGLPIALIFQQPDLVFSTTSQYFYVVRVFAIILGLIVTAGITYLSSYLMLFWQKKNKIK